MKLLIYTALLLFPIVSFAQKTPAHADYAVKIDIVQGFSYYEWTGKDFKLLKFVQIVQ